jgi:steroid delta-isomerase-like uncharacterized protein
MNPVDAAGLHRAMFAAIERRDLDALRGLFAVDAIHTSPDGEPMTGPEPVIDEVRAFVEAFPDLTIDIRHQHVPDPSRSIIEYTFRGIQTGPLEEVAPTGRSVTVVACSVLEARDGVIDRESDYFDTTSILTQLGVNGAITG